MALVVGIDLGSARVGIVGSHDELPIRSVTRETLKVNRRDLNKTVAAVIERVCPGAERAVLEHAPFYAPVGKSAAALASMAHNHEIASILRERLERELSARGVRVLTIPRASWAHRVVPRTRGGITDEMANAGLRAHVDASAWESLATQDERDALGAIVGTLLPRPKKVRRGRRGRGFRVEGPSLSPALRALRKRAANREFMRRFRGSISAEERARLGCPCKGSHRVDCPIKGAERRAAEDARRALRASAESERIAAAVAKLKAARERILS